MVNIFILYKKTCNIMAGGGKLGKVAAAFVFSLVLVTMHIGVTCNDIWMLQWSKEFSNGHAQFAQPIGDVDNDGLNEIAIGGFRDKNITILQWNPTSHTYEIEAIWNEGGGAAGGVAIGDINNDGENELVVVWDFCIDGKNRTCIYKWNGEHYEKIETIFLENIRIYYDCFIGDFNDDGENELLLFGWADEGAELVVYKWDGEAFVMIASWDDPTGTGYQTFIPMACIGDVDVDGKAEILCTPGRKLVVLDFDGKQFIATEIYKTTAGQWKITYGVDIGDINGNGIPEIALGLGSQVYEIPTALLFEYDVATGQYKEVWNATWEEEMGVIEAIDIADGDNDGKNELYAATNVVHVIGWNGLSYFEKSIIDETYGVIPSVNVGDCDNDGNNEVKVNVIRDYENRPLKEWIFKCKYNDETPPLVSIEKPKDHLYINGKPVIALPFTVVIGRISVEAIAEDGETGVKKVDFYLDGKLVQTVEKEPYEWTIEKLYGKHEITVIAYNEIGNTGNDATTFWAFIY